MVEYIPSEFEYCVETNKTKKTPQITRLSRNLRCFLFVDSLQLNLLYEHSKNVSIYMHDKKNQVTSEYPGSLKFILQRTVFAHLPAH